MIYEGGGSVGGAFIDGATCCKRQQGGACPGGQGMESKTNNEEM